MFEINFQRTPVTILLAIAVIALEVVCTLDPARRIYYYQDLHLGILPTVWDGQLWQPFTTALLHGNLLHAGFNLYVFWPFGQMLEPRLGSFRFLMLCVLLAYLSMMPQFIVTGYSLNGPYPMIVGLSGVVYGLFGMLWVGRRWVPQFNAVCDARTVNLLLVWFVLCIVLTRTGAMPVANMAHGCGLFFGVLYGLTAFDRGRHWHWAALAAVATSVVFATLVACPGHRGYELMRERQHMRAILKSFDPANIKLDGPFREEASPAKKTAPAEKEPPKK